MRPPRRCLPFSLPLTSICVGWPSKYKDVAILAWTLTENFPMVLMSKLPRKFAALPLVETRALVDQFLDVVASHKQLAVSDLVIRFLGFNPEQVLRSTVVKAADMAAAAEKVAAGAAVAGDTEEDDLFGVRKQRVRVQPGQRRADCRAGAGGSARRAARVVTGRRSTRPPMPPTLAPPLPRLGYVVFSYCLGGRNTWTLER